jgi:hypothetical protein
MACESRRKAGQTLAARMTEVEGALARLKRALTGGAVKVAIAPNGAIAFAGWQDRDDVTDACAYRSLTASNSWELRQAVAKAEAMSGRKVNVNAIAAGHHSHDSGATWSKH